MYAPNATKSLLSKIVKPLRDALKRFGKKDVKLEVTTSPVQLVSNYWDGGSKSDYYWVDLRTGIVSKLADSSYGNPAGGTYSSETPFVALIEAGFFCGKKVMPTVCLFDQGDETLGALLKGWLLGDTPEGIVCDRYRDLGMMD